LPREIEPVYVQKRSQGNMYTRMTYQSSRIPEGEMMQIDDDDDYSDYSSPLRGMSSLPEVRQDSRGRQVNLTPHAN